MSVLHRNNVYERSNGTSAMLFAHRFGCDQHLFRFVAPAFKAEFLFDHVGAGRSDLSAYNRPKYSSLDDNHMGWLAASAPAIMGNPDRPELGAELTNRFCRTAPEIAEQFVRQTFMYDNRDDLAKVRARTLVLQCEEDIIADEQVREYENRQLPRSELAILDATGHCPSLSAPE